MLHRDQRVHSDPRSPGAGPGDRRPPARGRPECGARRREQHRLQATASREGLPAGEVVVGVDGSPGSLAALRWAREEASIRGVGLRAVIAWEFPVESTFGTMLTVDDFHPVVAAEETLVKSLADAGVSPTDETVTTAAIEGYPAEVLLQAATYAQLLVVGSRGHGNLLGTLLASVSQYLVAHAPCSVVVIRTGTDEVDHTPSVT